ncbi:hypothetical protein SRHO_G00122310 [Serrasalmus rhombeus]
MFQLRLFLLASRGLVYRQNLSILDWGGEKKGFPVIMPLMKWLLLLQALAVAFSSLFTICLMTERGTQSTPTLPSEPQREITGPTVAKLRGLALISPMNLFLS